MDKSAPRSDCGNCGAALSGPYCSACGQHAHESARSIGVLFHDAWHLATHLDGRLWQTLYILLFKPGKQEFLLTVPSEPGQYEVVCTVICSEDHEGMHMKFTVLP